jgi:hypothetical protein
MSAADVTFARKTTTIRGFLERSWWGARDRLDSVDPVEEQYKVCYPSRGRTLVSPLVQELIERRREKMSLDALGDLVRFTRGLREERKAIVIITAGWRLFRPNNALLNDASGGIPGPPVIGIDPRTGKLATNDAVNPLLGPKSECDRDRMRLAQVDNEQQFYRMLDEANRANASFYPVDPRGLAVFAPTESELNTFSSSTLPAPSGSRTAAAAAEAAAIEAALGSLGGLTRELPLRVQVAAGWKSDGAAAIWAIGELGSGPDWKPGGEADLTLATGAGMTLATARARVEPGNRSFRVLLNPSAPLAAGEYVVRVRVRGFAAESIPAADFVRLQLPSPPGATGAVFIRRGPLTGNKDTVTADLRFRRTEQLRLEVPAGTEAGWTAKLLDRTGKPMTIPVATGRRGETDGPSWLTAQIVLAPLAVGDYIIELTNSDGTSRNLLAFRKPRAQSQAASRAISSRH